MRAVFVEEPDAALGVAEGHQLFAEELDAHGRTIGLGQLPREQRGNPVPAHGLAHRRAGADAGDQLVLFACQHASPSSMTAGLHGTNRNFGRLYSGPVDTSRGLPDIVLP